MRFADYLAVSGLTPAQFARLAGLTRQAVEHYRNAARMPGYDAMRAIAKATTYRVTADDFYGLKDQAERARIRNACTTGIAK